MVRRRDLKRGDIIEISGITGPAYFYKIDKQNNCVVGYGETDDLKTATVAFRNVIFLGTVTYLTAWEDENGISASSR